MPDDRKSRYESIYQAATLGIRQFIPSEARDLLGGSESRPLRANHASRCRPIDPSLRSG